MMMLPNCSGVVSRPWVCRLNWNDTSDDTGRAPMRPIGATTFCAWIAVMMSCGARFRLVRRLVSNQIRMEYFSRLNRFAWPTPGVRLISSSTLMVA